MQINKKTLNSIAKKLNIVSAAGRATLEQMLIGAPAGYNEESLTDYLVDQYKALIESCASSAASLGATEYNKYREQQTGDISFQATPENQYDPEITEDIVRNQIAAACDKKDLGLLAESLGKNIDASVMHAYSGTHYKNAKRDPLKPRYARVPTSPTPCKFCLMLASQGFVYLSKETAGEYNKYHPFCRCQAVPQFDKAGREIEIEGYNPKKLYEQYKNGDFGFNSKSTKTKTPRVSAKMPKIEKPLLSTTPSAAPLPAKVYGGEWNQVEDMQKFISNVFDPDDYVGVCGEFWDSNGRLVPTRGLYQRTASRINDVLNNTHNVSAAVGRYKRATGAYVRINPLDGKGVSDINVKSLKYTLIECDTGSLEQQYGFIKALNLPTKAVVTSGKKSVHALVRIDAKDLDEYKQRVALLHAECKAAGFNVDTSTKNPSRYMRIPGVKRGDGRQVLVSLNEGAKSWDDWVKWADEIRNPLTSFNPIESEKAVPIARAEAKKWLDKIDNNAKTLINRYTYNQNDNTPKFYERINSFIRNGYVGEKDYTEQVDIISTALKQSNLKNDYRCYRGSNFNPFEGMEVGETATAKQFLSTSLTQNGSFVGKYDIIVYAQRGTNAAYIEELSDTAFKKQREMLFDKDVVYEVLYNQGDTVIVRTKP